MNIAETKIEERIEQLRIEKNRIKTRKIPLSCIDHFVQLINKIDIVDKIAKAKFKNKHHTTLVYSEMFKHSLDLTLIFHTPLVKLLSWEDCSTLIEEGYNVYLSIINHIYQPLQPNKYRIYSGITHRREIKNREAKYFYVKVYWGSEWIYNP